MTINVIYLQNWVHTHATGDTFTCVIKPPPFFPTSLTVYDRRLATKISTSIQILPTFCLPTAHSTTLLADITDVQHVLLMPGDPAPCLSCALWNKALFVTHAPIQTEKSFCCNKCSTTTKKQSIFRCSSFVVHSYPSVLWEHKLYAMYRSPVRGYYQ